MEEYWIDGGADGATVLPVHVRVGDRSLVFSY